MTRRKPIVAIDGPVGAGKSTTARKVAEELGFLYVDTGAMYRAVTLDVLEHGVDPNDNAGVERVVQNSKVELRTGNSGQRTFLNGVDVSERIRERDVTRAVSAVSAMKCVRERMTEIQRELGSFGGIVMEGRDIGTVVFPHAEFKIYLDASVEVRAKRRFDELYPKDPTVSFTDLLEEIRERDRLNTMRELAPLRKADDAVIIDTTNLTFDEQVQKIVGFVREQHGFDEN
jgi:cytidylate kinase